MKWPAPNRNQFVYAPSQWETTLQCSVISHWLSAYTELSLLTPPPNTRNSQTMCRFFREYSTMHVSVRYRELFLAWGSDHSVYVPIQWETTLQCNVVSHWLGTYTKWSLMRTFIIYSDVCHWHDSSCINHCTTGIQQMLCNCFKAHFTGWKSIHWGRERMAAVSQTTFSNAFSWMKSLLIPIKISLQFVPKGPINNIPSLVQTMAWPHPGDKPLSEPMMVRLPTHVCVTRPQWVNVVLCMNYISIGDFHIVTNLL